MTAVAWVVIGVGWVAIGWVYGWSAGHRSAQRAWRVLADEWEQAERSQRLAEAQQQLIIREQADALTRLRRRLWVAEERAERAAADAEAVTRAIERTPSEN